RRKSRQQTRRGRGSRATSRGEGAFLSSRAKVSLELASIVRSDQPAKTVIRCDGKREVGALLERPLLGFPRNDDTLELVEAERQEVADERDHEQPDIHLLDRERAPRTPDQVAEPALRPDHLG